MGALLAWTKISREHQKELVRAKGSITIVALRRSKIPYFLLFKSPLVLPLPLLTWFLLCDSLWLPSAWPALRPLEWRQYVYLKQWTSSKLNGITSQKAVLFVAIAARTSNPAGGILLIIKSLKLLFGLTLSSQLFAFSSLFTNNPLLLFCRNEQLYHKWPSLSWLHSNYYYFHVTLKQKYWELLRAQSMYQNQ